MYNKERLLSDFLEYVQIDSETKNEFNFMMHIKNKLEEIGLKVVLGDEGSKCGSNGNNIYAYLEGDSSKSPIMLSSHLDTVKPGNGIKPSVDGNYVITDGTTILGGDDKAGVAVIVEAVRTIVENNLSSRPIELLLPIYEEGGLNGSKFADYSKITATECVVFDSGGKAGEIIRQAPAQNSIIAKIEGKPAHAGVAPEEGISALSVAADAINNMNLYRIDNETTANFGVVTGGLASNIVMPNMTMVGEARSLRNDKLEAQTKHMVEVLEESAKKFGASVDVEVKAMYSAFFIEDNDPFLVDVSDTLSNLGHEVKYLSTGGGSDANNFFQNGIKCVNMPCGMEKVHTLDERLNIQGMNEACEFLVTYLTK